MRPTISWATLRDNSRADLRPVQFLRRYPVVWLTKHFWSFEPDLELVSRSGIITHFAYHFCTHFHCLVFSPCHYSRYCSYLPAAMSSRRRPPADLAAVKKSRSSFTGAITRAFDKLKAIRSDDSASVNRINTKDIDRILVSIERTETGFLQTLEDAQDFTPEGEAEEPFQQEEETAMDNFSSSISAVRDQAEYLLTLKSVLTGLRDLTCDITALESSLAENPESNHTSSLQTMETSFSKLRQEWKKANLPKEHLLQGELDACSKTLINLGAQVATVKARPDTRLLDSPVSSHYRGTRDESKLPTIDLPHFHGDILEWSTFWSKFVDAVDKKDHLSDTTKLIYLRQAIKDPEAQTMLHSPTETPETYKQTVLSLQKRYERTKKIHRGIVTQILQMPDAKQNSTELRRLVDKARSYVGSLKQTGHFSLETFLTSVFYTHLPYKLKVSWDLHHNKSKVIAPYEELLDYVSEHAYSLADNQPTPSKVEPAEKKPQKPTEKRQNNYKRSNIHVVTPNPTYKWDCAICKTEKHPLFLCTKWQT